MRKILSLLMTLMLLILCLAGCAEEVSREAVDVRYTPARQVVETNYVHKYDWLSGKYVLVPEVQTVHKSESYGILWKITYDDGSTNTQWKSCTYNEYVNTQKQLQKTTE